MTLNWHKRVSFVPDVHDDAALRYLAAVDGADLSTLIRIAVRRYVASRGMGDPADEGARE